jgi:hypothetical protein
MKEASMPTNNIVSRLSKCVNEIFKGKTAILLTLCLSSTANAVLIDFDDRPVIHPDPDDICFCDHPLTDEYLDQGLLIDGGFLVGETLADGTHQNELLGSNFLSLRFVGNLPTQISMNISAAFEQAVFLHFYGEDGLLGKVATSGYAGPIFDTPYEDDQLVTFTSPMGVSFVTLEAFYGLRTGAIVDNLQYEYNAVPESSSLLLLVLGILGITLRNIRKNSHRINV